MKHHWILIVLTIFSNIAFSKQIVEEKNDTTLEDMTVQYLQTCPQVQFSGFYILPGTDTDTSSGLCLNPTTGIMAELQSDETTIVYSLSPMAIRVLKLEAKISNIEKQLGIATEVEQDAISEITETMLNHKEREFFQTAPVEYVKKCNFFPTDYYYIPGTDLCMNDTTGVIAQLQAGGTIVYSESALSSRILKLENQFLSFEKELGLKPLLEESADTIVPVEGWPNQTGEKLPQTKIAPIQYIKICSLYGAGYYYLSKTDSCLNASTGIIKNQSSEGTVRSISDLARRVLMLESRRLVITERLRKETKS